MTCCVPAEAIDFLMFVIIIIIIVILTSQRDSRKTEGY